MIDQLAKSLLVSPDLLVFVATTTVVALLMFALGLPLYLRRVKPNPIYGLRTSDTYANEEVWYAANSAAGRDLMILAAAQLAVIYAPLVFKLRWPFYPFIVLGTLVLGVLIVAAIGIARGHILLKRKQAS